VVLIFLVSRIKSYRLTEYLTDWIGLITLVWEKRRLSPGDPLTHLVVELQCGVDIHLDFVHVMSLKVEESQRHIVARTWTSERVQKMVCQSSFGELKTNRCKLMTAGQN